MAALVVQAPAVAVPVAVSGVIPWRIQAPAAEAGVTIGVWPIISPAGTVPSVRYAPLPLTISVDGIDVTDLVEGPNMPTWSSGVSTTGTATIVLVDLDGVIPWPIVPTDDDRRMCPVSIGGDWWQGVVVGWSRQYLYPGWRYTLRCEGYERILGIDPQEPYDSGGTYEVVTAPNGYRYMRAIDESDYAPASTWPWIGRRYNRVGTAWRQGLQDQAWVWSGGAAGGPVPVPSYWGGTLTPNPARISPFSIGYGAGDTWPETLTEEADGSNMREGVGVETRLPNVHQYVSTGGVTGAGHDVIQVNTSLPPLAQLAGLIYLGSRGGWEKRWVATLPAGALDRHVRPQPGKVVRLNVDPYTTEARYYLITSVSGAWVARGEGEGGVEWTIQMGNGSRPSFTINEYDAADDYPPAPEVTGLECSEVHDMGADSVQYIYAWLLDAENNRVRLNEGTVEWTVFINSVDRAAGSEDLGWWVEERKTDVVYSTDQPLGFAYCTLHCGTEAARSQAVVLTARLLPPTGGV